MSKYRKSDIDSFAAMFKALSNPQRLRIFLKLASCCVPRVSCEVTPEGMHRCVGDLGGDLGRAASTVSHHIKELRNSGLLHMERHGRKIECWISEDTLHQLASFFDSAGEPELVSQVSKSGKGGNGGKRKR